jgi:hypothetical protein
MLRTSPVTDAALGFSLGYFATDMMLLVLYYPSFGGPEMALHHLAALTSVAAAAFQARALCHCWGAASLWRCMVQRCSSLLACGTDV